MNKLYIKSISIKNEKINSLKFIININNHSLISYGGGEGEGEGEGEV
jgi:hypothetical protein